MAQLMRQACAWVDRTNGKGRSILVDSGGRVEVNNPSEAIVSSDGTTNSHRVQIMGAHNSNLRTVKVGDGGSVNVEVDHSWDNTNQIIDGLSITAGATATSSTFDLGQGVSHEVDGGVEFFIDNSAGVELLVEGETSYNGSSFYSTGNSSLTITSSDTKFYFNQEEVGMMHGHRYMRLKITNNDGSNASTVSVQVGYYK